MGDAKGESIFFFSSVWWLIWKARNLFIFQQHLRLEDDILRTATAMTEYLELFLQECA